MAGKSILEVTKRILMKSFIRLTLCCEKLIDVRSMNDR